MPAWILTFERSPLRLSYRVKLLKYYNKLYIEIAYNTMSAILMISYARSGGTILSQCLGSLDNIILISEVNPLFCPVFTVKQQAERWYNIKLKHDNYQDSILELYDICAKRNQKLVIRDFSLIDFTPCKQNSFNPSRKLSNFIFLKEKVDIHSFAFIRDAIDIWISRNMPSYFFSSYKEYIEEIFNYEIPFFKYEDFCIDPERILKGICEKTDIKFSSCFKNYINNNNVTGDNTLSFLSRGRKAKVITSLLRKKIPHNRIKELNQNPAMKVVNRMCGYPGNYYGMDMEKEGSQIWIEMKFMLKEFLKRSGRLKS